MAVETYKAKARAHWTKWLPRKVAALKSEGLLESSLQTAAVSAQERVSDLMAQGYRQHEAEEVALPEFVLLRPERSGEPDREARELAALNREEAEMMKAMRG